MLARKDAQVLAERIEIRKALSGMTSRLLLGMLTPSSNTTLEPVTASMLAEMPEAARISAASG